MSNQQPGSNHRSITGLVTKLVGDGATYGFINDEIFFPQTNVSGGPAAVGDQVFAECEFSAHLPIKWNATSVKILNKAGQIQQNNPRHDIQQQQDMMNQQQFNQSAPVAVTYQQHRQQRQQRQVSGNHRQDSSAKEQNQQPQQSSDLTTRLLDHTTGTGDFFGSASAKAFSQQQQQQQQQQPDSNIQPFQEQPMGPPNFTYTSQLGSAFVQNQFVAPFMNQPPPTMLPQQQPQQQQPQQHLLPTNQMHSQNSNQHRQNQHNKPMGGRFNNNHDKNDRQSNRRNQNRNNDKFDRSRSGDREPKQGNRSSKAGEGRDRSAGRANKRNDIPVRPSPPPHSSARSSTSVSSDRGTKSSRKHYDVQNIPRVQIMTNMNAYNMKQRCPSSVHVPSDLKDIILNRYFRLDLKNTPKPLTFTIEQAKNDADASEKVADDKLQVDDEAIKVKEKEGDSATSQIDTQVTEQKEDQVTVVEPKVEGKADVKPVEQPTPPSSRSDSKLNHKYGVKVILVSLPDLEEIYKSVFGPNLDSFSAEGKSHSKLDEVVSMLCNKGSNNGHSLIGGKFDPVLDGFIEGQRNEFERHERQPDLVATCKRVVSEQIGLDLGACRSWTLLSTFIYNHKTDYFSPKASIEYSFIYMPHLWTILGDSLNPTTLDEETLQPSDTKPEAQDEATVEIKPEPQEATSELAPNASSTNELIDDARIVAPCATSDGREVTFTNIESVADLKVADLKAELDKRDIKYKNGAKKAELVSLLQQCLQTNQQPQKDVSIEQSPADKKEEEEGLSAENLSTKPDDRTELEEGEVVANADSSPECDTQPEVESTIKRKASDDDAEGEPASKKVCSEDTVLKETTTAPKEQKVKLIKESFRVKARDDQQQLSLVSLLEATQASRYDQFELSVASIILKESLTQHLSEYILTTLVEDYRQKSTPTGGSAASTSNSSSQETSSDTNNNSTKSAFKNPTSSSSSSTVADSKVNLKELPVDRYINLAFSYFDSTHMGYVYFEDLNKLFNNTSQTISKRALTSLVGDTEKYNYRTLPELSSKFKPTYIYEFPEQFRRLPGSTSNGVGSDSENPSFTVAGKTIEYKGVSYDVDRLIQQVEDAETTRVSLVDRFNYAIENSDKQAEEIHVLEVSQKSLAKAIKAQNDELCDLKRERDSIKKKYESVRKTIKGTITTLSDLVVKDDKQ